MFIVTKSNTGVVDYNDTSTSAGVALPANTWTDMPNDGAGANTRLNFLPNGITSLLDTSTGYLDLTEPKNGDSIIIRNNFKVIPNNNKADLSFRYLLGGGGAVYPLETFVARLDSGAGKPYTYTLSTHLVYMGDDNTRLNPVKLQLNLSKNGTFINSGIAIQILRR